MTALVFLYLGVVFVTAVRELRGPRPPATIHDVEDDVDLAAATATSAPTPPLFAGAPQC